MKGLVFLKLGDTFLEVLSLTDPPPLPQDKFLQGYKRIALEVDDMDETIEFLKSKGVEVISGPNKSVTSIRAKIEDPDGIAIELRQWLKDADGNRVKSKFYR